MKVKDGTGLYYAIWVTIRIYSDVLTLKLDLLSSSFYTYVYKESAELLNYTKDVIIET